MASKPYVLVWRSDIDPGQIKLVGPFEAENVAATWGRIWEKAHQGNPCWQVISLADDDEGFNQPHFQWKGVKTFSLAVCTPGTPEANA